MNSDAPSNPAADSVSEPQSDAREFVQKNFSQTPDSQIPDIAELKELMGMRPELVQNSAVSWRELVAIFAVVILTDIIRNGIKALLSQKYDSLRTRHFVLLPKDKYAWTRVQFADEILLHQLDVHRSHFDRPSESGKPLQHDHDIDRFNDYVYRWY